MTAAPIRCIATHPDLPDRECGRRLNVDVMPDTVTIIQARAPAPGCTLIHCPRCGAKYLVCPSNQAA